ncbi:MAG: protein translocase subunit SecF, partial [Angustibacter sp.]
IFIATPMLADLREREPQMKALAKRIAAKRSTGPAAPSDTPAAESAELVGVAADPRPARPTGPRNQPRRKNPRKQR